MHAFRNIFNGDHIDIFVADDQLIIDRHKSFLSCRCWKQHDFSGILRTVLHTDNDAFCTGTQQEAAKYDDKNTSELHKTGFKSG